MYKTEITNPILTGFNPDPCVLKVENEYYLVVSSFEWLPGIRVYHSKDLVNWNHCTDILTSQVNLKGNPENCSVWAPQLSFHNGLFYLVYTNVRSTVVPFKDCHNYLITASDIKGPWSQPIYLNSSGFDPSLFHDHNKTWLLNEIWDYRLSNQNKSAGVILQEYDVEKQCLIGNVYHIFKGTELGKTEAPHLYKHKGMYYLITAEGGTGVNHSVTICRSKNITGPYELSPYPSLITARDKQKSKLQCTGHASLIEGPQGYLYIAYLCTRPLFGKYPILGRETALQQVEWTSDNWLKLSNQVDNSPQVKTFVQTEHEIQQRTQTTFKDYFNTNSLLQEWNSRRKLISDEWCSVNVAPGYLRIFGGESPQSYFDHNLLAIRQKDFAFHVETKLIYEPLNYLQMAGMMLFLNESNYKYCYLTYDEELGKVLRFMSSSNGNYYLSNKLIPIRTTSIQIKFEVTDTNLTIFYREIDNSRWIICFDNIDISCLSGGFTGNFIGLSVQDLGMYKQSYADFAYFKYQPYLNKDK